MIQKLYESLQAGYESLKPNIRKATSLGLTATTSFLAGCGAADQPTIIDDANHVFEEGIPKIVKIQAYQENRSFGPEMRYIDMDGDGKTIEQYVRLYGTTTTGFSYWMGLQENLLKEGFPAVKFGRQKDAEPMTNEQIKVHNVIYQILLDMQEDGVLNNYKLANDLSEALGQQK